MKKELLMVLLMTLTACTAGTAGTSSNDSGLEVIELEMGSWYFSPEEITLESGKEYLLRITNTGGRHNVEFPGWFITDVQTEGTKTYTITAPEPGVYEGHCDIYCGEGHSNMKMRIIVQ